MPVITLLDDDQVKYTLYYSPKYIKIYNYIMSIEIHNILALNEIFIVYLLDCSAYMATCWNLFAFFICNILKSVLKTYISCIFSSFFLSLAEFICWKLRCIIFVILCRWWMLSDRPLRPFVWKLIQKCISLTKHKCTWLNIF